MDALLEQPLYPIFLGVLAEAVLVMAFLQSGRRWLIGMMVLVALLAGGGVMLERSVITDREAVEATMHQIAADIANNDVAAVVAHISTSATEKRAETERILAMVKFRSIEIRRILDIDILPDLATPRAETNFTVKPIVRDRSGVLGEDFAVPRRLEVTFIKEDDTWRVLNYEIFNLMGDKSSPLRP